MTSVINPNTPYIGPIPGGLQENTKITISGLPEHKHNQFTISLQAGPSRDPRNDVALWFNPRFNENFVVRNTLQTGSWGSEERGGGFPFQKGAPTEVVILAKKHHYKVLVNGENFIEFAHRLGIEQISHLIIEEGLKVYYIRFESKEEVEKSLFSDDQTKTTDQTKASFGIDMGSIIGGLLPGIKELSDAQTKATDQRKASSGIDMGSMVGGIMSGFKPPSDGQTKATDQTKACSGPDMGSMFGGLMSGFKPPSDDQTKATDQTNASFGPDMGSMFGGGFKLACSGMHPSDFAQRPTPAPAGPFPGPYGPTPGSSGQYPMPNFGGSISHQTPGLYPTPGMGPYPTNTKPYQSHPNTGNFPHTGDAEGGPIINSPIPKANTIPGGLGEGKVINVVGTPKNGASRFIVNLVSGSDIALHFEVRFDYGTDKKAIITNKRQNGRWGIEKKEFFVFDFPFPVNQTFDMAIEVKWNVFKVRVNGKELFETFHHEFRPLSKIDTIKVEGDVAISQIRSQ